MITKPMETEIKTMNREVTHDNIKYGMLVECHMEDNGIACGVKVHFFNKKGVLVGRYYEFVAYSKLRLREPYKYDGRAPKDHPVNKRAGKKRNYQRFFMDQRFESLKKAAFVSVLNLTSRLLRFTQKYMD